MVPALGRLRQKDCEFEASMVNLEKTCLKESRRREMGRKEKKKEKRRKCSLCFIAREVNEFSTGKLGCNQTCQKISGPKEIMYCAEWN